MKKLLLCLLALACCFAVSACKDEKKPSTNNGDNTEQVGGEETPEIGQETELPRVDF